MEQAFRSKVDFWLILALVGVPILVLEFILDGSSVGDRAATLLAVVIVAVVLAIFLWLYLTTRYTLTDEYLLVKSGPFSWSIPLRDIYEIEPTRNPMSSPALSLDRLLIRYGGGAELMISPADKDGFMMALRKRTKAGARESSL
jgi:membrane protein YdbS with pleckstrin-like domain